MTAHLAEACESLAAQTLRGIAAHPAKIFAGLAICPGACYGWLHAGKHVFSRQGAEARIGKQLEVSVVLC